MPTPGGVWAQRVGLAAALASVLSAGAGRAGAQTHYYNLDAGRPTRVEDALPTELYGLDLHLAALRLERVDGGTYRWRGEPKISAGIFPMTSLEIRAPITHIVPRGTRARELTALSGLGIGALRALNVERTWLPALALAGEALLPVGGLSSGRASYAVQMLATKTTPLLRAHLNASLGTWGLRPPRQIPGSSCPPGFYPVPGGGCQEVAAPIDGPCALGPADGEPGGFPTAAVATRCGATAGSSTSRQRLAVASGPYGLRWSAGIGIDRALPFQSTLVMADVIAERFVGLFDEVDWTAEVGLRRQVTSQIVLDAGVARHFAGVIRSSSATLGVTYSLAARAPRRPRLVPPAYARDPSATGPYEQAYLPARHNWSFRDRYPRADRLLNAFDYGHAILYETLLRRRELTDAGARLDGPIYNDVVGRVLRRPPRLTLEERAIGSRYATLVPELLAMFEWAHVLHRQLYDVMADERLTADQRERRAREVLLYYQSRSDLALSAAPKTMGLMEGQPFSLAFRRAAPKFNGLIWSYHWLQVALYEALLAADDAAGRRANVEASLARFRAMVDGAPATLPTVMPMSPAVAPRFSERFPDAAIIFDNLHALHDVAADILASPLIPAADKRAAILKAAAQYRDSTTALASRAEWLEHSVHMGVEQMGGRAPVASTGTVAPGALPYVPR